MGNSFLTEKWQTDKDKFSNDYHITTENKVYYRKDSFKLNGELKKGAIAKYGTIGRVGRREVAEHLVLIHNTFISENEEERKKQMEIIIHRELLSSIKHILDVLSIGTEYSEKWPKQLLEKVFGKVG